MPKATKSGDEEHVSIWPTPKYFFLLLTLTICTQGIKNKKKLATPEEGNAYQLRKLKMATPEAVNGISEASDQTFPAADVKNELNPGLNTKVEVDPISSAVAASLEAKVINSYFTAQVL